jgi:hypothetical protein
MAEYSLVETANNLSVVRPGEEFNEQSVMINGIKPVIESLNNEAKLKKESRSVINVLEYIDNFLPMHCGYVTDEDRFTIEDWLDFAGGPYNEVDLVDKDGNIVATVPSMYPNNSYVLLNDEVEEIDESVTSLGRKFEIINNTGDNYRTISRKSRTDLYESMLDRFDGNVIEAHKAKWNAFFVKMGLFKPTNETNEQQTNSEDDSIANGESNPFISY